MKFIALLLIFFAISCTKKQPVDLSAMTAEQIIQRGKSIYMTNCIACHNVDPSKDGVLGPAVKGSSLELLTARLMKADYPPGYTPKSKTNTMVALPHLEKEIPALTQYLNSMDVP